jgi:hypothetical protein
MIRTGELTKYPSTHLQFVTVQILLSGCARRTHAHKRMCARAHVCVCACVHVCVFILLMVFYCRFIFTFGVGPVMNVLLTEFRLYVV